MYQSCKFKRLTLIFICIIMVVSCIPFSASAANANANTIFEFCIKELKLNTAGACGVLANIEAESNFNPNLYGDGGYSYGICQWNTSRFTNLKNYCNKNGYDWKTLQGQLYFLKYELTNNKSDTGYILDKLKDVANTAQGAGSAAHAAAAASPASQASAAATTAQQQLAAFRKALDARPRYAAGLSTRMQSAQSWHPCLGGSAAKGFAGLFAAVPSPAVVRSLRFRTSLRWPSRAVGLPGHGSLPRCSDRLCLLRPGLSSAL